MNILATPLGWVMKICYELVGNYGVALLLFTFITRLVVFPLSVKQQKSTARMAMLNPQLEKIKKKYKNDKEKLNEETMKLYNKENVNPMASCLPMIITLVILWSLIPVIYGPLTYVSGANKNHVKETTTVVTNLYNVSKDVSDEGTTFEKLLSDAGNDTEKLAKELSDEKYEKAAKLSDSEREKIAEIIAEKPDVDKYMLESGDISEKLITSSRSELVIFNIAKSDYADIIPYDDVKEKATDFDYTLFNRLFLGTVPDWKSLTAIIPIISAVLQLVTTIISQRFSKKNNPTAANMGGSMKAMLYAMPLFSLWIGFSFPAGLGLYWIYSSVFALLQTIILNVFYSPERVQEMVKKDMAKNKNKKKKSSFMERAMAAQNKQNGISTDDPSDDEDDDDGEERKLSKSEVKELQRKKLNEARRRMAEKYGEDYDEKK